MRLISSTGFLIFTIHVVQNLDLPVGLLSKIVLPRILAVGTWLFHALRCWGYHLLQKEIRISVGCMTYHWKGYNFFIFGWFVLTHWTYLLFYSFPPWIILRFHTILLCHPLRLFLSTDPKVSRGFQGQGLFFSNVMQFLILCLLWLFRWGSFKIDKIIYHYYHMRYLYIDQFRQDVHPNTA